MVFSDSGKGTALDLSMSEAIGQSDAFLTFQEQVSSVAPIDRPVLILGERGT
ncbi:MAG: AAA family ATPase, partial [Desulfobacteraceae bacterium]|nr:AAA family ATPase [Desulfobacteraceae bacterium]